MNLIDDQKKWFLDHYKRLCKVGLAEAKRQKGKEAESPLSPKPVGVTVTTFI